MNRVLLLWLTVLLCLLIGACATEDPAVAPSPTAGESETPGGEVTATPGDNLLLAQGNTGTGIDYRLVLVPGDPVCVQLRRTNDEGDFMLCDEKPAQDFNGDERLRFKFGGLNPEELPKFVIGITAEDVARVVVNLPDGESPGVATEASDAAPGRRFFVVMLNPEPAQHVAAIRGLDAAGKTVAGFSLGEPGAEPGEGGPSPLPTG